MKVRRSILLIVISILTSVLLVSCNGKSNQSDSEDKVTYVSEEDVDMNKAMQKAKDNFSKFENAFLNNNDSVYYGFTVKLCFTHKDGSIEHMWLDDLVHNENGFSGILFNYPVGETDLKYGDMIEVDPTVVSDWMYTDGTTGKTYGGYTVKVLLDKMSASERKEFEENNELNFAD